MSDVVPSFEEIPEGSVGAGDNRVYDQVTVRGSEDPPADIVGMALRVECPDCRVNVEIYKNDGEWAFEVAHDEICPWLARHEKGEV